MTGFAVCPRLEVLHPQKPRMLRGKCETHLERLGRQLPPRGQRRINEPAANRTRASSAPGLFRPSAPRGVFHIEGELRAFSPCWSALLAPQAALTGVRAPLSRCPQAAQAALAAFISFLSGRAGSRDAGVLLFLAVTQPPSCPGKCFSPFRVPGYLSVTHALRNGSRELRDSPDKRLRSRRNFGSSPSAPSLLSH